MNPNIKFALITGIVLLCIIAVIYFIKPSEKPEIQYIKGKDSVVVKNDTTIVYVPKYIATEKTIVDTFHLFHYNQDSSIVRDTVIQNMDTAIIAITTYPKIDSLKYNLDLRLSEKLTTIKDSIWITRVDTLKTTVNTQDWWDTYIVGTLTTVIIGVLVFFGLK